MLSDGSYTRPLLASEQTHIDLAVPLPDVVDALIELRRRRSHLLRVGAIELQPPDQANLASVLSEPLLRPLLWPAKSTQITTTHLDEPGLPVDGELRAERFLELLDAAAALADEQGVHPALEAHDRMRQLPVLQPRHVPRERVRHHTLKV